MSLNTHTTHLKFGFVGQKSSFAKNLNFVFSLKKLENMFSSSIWTTLRSSSFVKDVQSFRNSLNFDFHVQKEKILMILKSEGFCSDKEFPKILYLQES